MVLKVAMNFMTQVANVQTMGIIQKHEHEVKHTLWTTHYKQPKR